MSLTQPSGQPKGMQAGEFLSASSPSQITFNLTNLPAPPELYVRPEDTLLIYLAGSAASIAAVQMNYRLLLPDGSLQVGTQEYSPIFNRAGNRFILPLTEGYLVNLAVRVTGSCRRGQCFVSITLQRGLLFPGNTNKLLCMGYVSSDSPISWPEPTIVNALDGMGALFSNTVGAPGPGTEWSQTVPIGARWRIVSTRSIFTTSVAVALRAPRVQITDALNNVLYQACIVGTIPASTAASITMSDTGAYTPGDALSFTIPMPVNMTLLQGWTIRTLTQNMQAADQWSSIFQLIEEYLEE